MIVEKEKEAVTYCKAFSFNASNKALTPVLINNQPYFIAVEVCEILEIKNPNDCLRNLDSDEKLTSVLPRSGQNREVNLLSESGLYSLIFQSRKPEAKVFRKWVTSEVLPAIRQTGSYTLIRQPNAKEKPTEAFYAMLANAINIAGGNRRLAEYIKVCESSLCELYTRPDNVSLKMRGYIEKCCQKIIATNGLTCSLPYGRPNRRMSSTSRMDFLADICKIDNSELRKALLAKLMEGRAL